MRWDAGKSLRNEILRRMVSVGCQKIQVELESKDFCQRTIILQTPVIRLTAKFLHDSGDRFLNFQIEIKVIRNTTQTTTRKILKVWKV